MNKKEQMTVPIGPVNCDLNPNPISLHCLVSPRGRATASFNPPGVLQHILFKTETLSHSQQIRGNRTRCYHVGHAESIVFFCHHTNIDISGVFANDS